MPIISSFVEGFTLAAALIAAIGAQNVFVLRQGLRREHVGAIVTFCASADALLIAAGVAGLGELLRVAPDLAVYLTLGGAAFLACYGVTALHRSAKDRAMVATTQTRVTLGRALASTAGFTLLNPHVYLDTVLLMGTVGSSLPVILRPAFVAGAATASLTWFAALGYGARLLTPVFARPAAWRILDGVVGVTMLALSASLISRVLQGA